MDALQVSLASSAGGKGDFSGACCYCLPTDRRYSMTEICKETELFHIMLTQLLPRPVVPYPFHVLGIPAEASYTIWWKTETVNLAECLKTSDITKQPNYCTYFFFFKSSFLYLRKYPPAFIVLQSCCSKLLSHRDSSKFCFLDGESQTTWVCPLVICNYYFYVSLLKSFSACIHSPLHQ